MNKTQTLEAGLVGWRERFAEKVEARHEADAVERQAAARDPRRALLRQVGALRRPGRSPRHQAARLAVSRSSRNHFSRSAYGTAAFAGDVEGSTNSRVSPSRRSACPAPVVR